MSDFLLKICGLRTQEHLDAVAAIGAHMCGFIFHPQSPRHCSCIESKKLHSHHLCRVGVFVHEEVHTIAQYMKEARLHMAQIHGTPPGLSMYEHTKKCAKILGAERLISVQWPQRFAQQSRHAWQEHLHALASHCAYFLLDAGIHGGGHNVQLATASLLFDTPLPRPCLVAGGINAENCNTILHQLAALQPAGMDINSGVEEQKGQKSIQKIYALQQRFPFN